MHSNSGSTRAMAGALPPIMIVIVPAMAEFSPAGNRGGAEFDAQQLQPGGGRHLGRAGRIKGTPEVSRIKMSRGFTLLADRRTFHSSRNRTAAQTVGAAFGHHPPTENRDD